MPGASSPRLLPLAMLAAAATLGAAQQPRFSERVEVARILVDARVIDDAGRPIPDLTADDFRVRIGGKRARVDSVQWVSASSAEPADVVEPSGDRGVVAGAETPPAAAGRLIVYVFQKSFERGRMPGLMRMLLEARGFLGTLSPRDRVAVVSFDSRLQIWLDFTSNLDRVARVFEHGILFETPPPVQESAPPSLVARLDLASARRAYTIERALRMLGESLEGLPGAKSVVLIGHGFGRFGVGGVTMENEYDEMRDALQRARAAVFCLDVTDADYHSLEAGLQLVAEDTGGFFVRTHVFPQQALDRLAGALSGYYVLFVENPGLDRGTHRVDVTLLRGKGNVLARSTYLGR
jgi:VWFA-related protein